MIETTNVPLATGQRIPDITYHKADGMARIAFDRPGSAQRLSPPDHRPDDDRSLP
ncbi:MAG: hypothetical protein R3E79_17155 [Caldilineaceae bacterium]